MSEQQALLDFWYSERIAKHWFSSTPALDEEIRSRFEPLWQRAAAGELDAWADTPEGALALAIVLDQLPLNMFRGRPAAFATEQRAVAVARPPSPVASTSNWRGTGCCSSTCPSCTARTGTTRTCPSRCSNRLGLDSHWAEHHRGIVRRFGRFPTATPSWAGKARRKSWEESAYLASDAAFKG
jgi:uncharacterized protein (DUF924 family)